MPTKSKAAKTPSKQEDLMYAGILFRIDWYTVVDIRSIVGSSSSRPGSPRNMGFLCMYTLRHESVCTSRIMACWRSEISRAWYLKIWAVQFYSSMKTVVPTGRLITLTQFINSVFSSHWRTTSHLLFYDHCYNKGTRITKQENKPRCHNNRTTVTYRHGVKSSNNWMIKFLSLKVKALRPSKHPFTISRSTMSNIPEGLNLLQHRCASLKFR